MNFTPKLEVNENSKLKREKGLNAIKSLKRHPVEFTEDGINNFKVCGKSV